ncbi:MAG: hypothetical protein AAF674_02150 [Pseudomonadota bacterium]
MTDSKKPETLADHDLDGVDAGGHQNLVMKRGRPSAAGSGSIAVDQHQDAAEGQPVARQMDFTTKNHG